MFVWDCVREAVLERDDYTCQQCGLSKEQAERAYWQTHDLAKERSDSTDEFWRRWRAYGVTEFQIFEVDHIERVADGGHPFEESNLQTLCEHCHRDKTAAENRTGEPSIEERPEPGSTPTWTPRPTAGGGGPMNTGVQVFDRSVSRIERQPTPVATVVPHVE